MFPVSISQHSVAFHKKTVHECFDAIHVSLSVKGVFSCMKIITDTSHNSLVFGSLGQLHRLVGLLQ